MRIQIINGPNINLLGKREPGIYGAESFESYLEKLRTAYPDLEIDYYQSNIEGEMIDKIHEVGFEDTGIILNAGAYTHTSIQHQLFVMLRPIRNCYLSVTIVLYFSHSSPSLKEKHLPFNRCLMVSVKLMLVSKS